MIVTLFVMYVFHSLKWWPPFYECNFHRCGPNSSAANLKERSSILKTFKFLKALFLGLAVIYRTLDMPIKLLHGKGFSNMIGQISWQSICWYLIKSETQYQKQIYTLAHIWSAGEKCYTYYLIRIKFRSTEAQNYLNKNYSYCMLFWYSIKVRCY